MVAASSISVRSVSICNAFLRSLAQNFNRNLVPNRSMIIALELRCRSPGRKPLNFSAVFGRRARDSSLASDATESIRALAPEGHFLKISPKLRFFSSFALFLALPCLALAIAAPAQQPTQQPPTEKETHITPEQARQLFALVDEL